MENKNHNEFIETECLNCGEEISLFEGDLLTKCKNCNFYNTILPEKTFEAYIEDQQGERINDPRFDILVLKKKKVSEQQYHYAFPDLTKEEFESFRERSPRRAEILLSFLKGSTLSERGDNTFRCMKFEFLEGKREYIDKIKYLQIKIKILRLIK